MVYGIADCCLMVEESGEWCWGSRDRYIKYFPVGNPHWGGKSQRDGCCGVYQAYVWFHTVYVSQYKYTYISPSSRRKVDTWSILLSASSQKRDEWCGMEYIKLGLQKPGGRIPLHLSPPPPLLYTLNLIAWSLLALQTNIFQNLDIYSQWQSVVVVCGTSRQVIVSSVLRASLLRCRYTLNLIFQKMKRGLYRFLNSSKPFLLKIVLLRMCLSFSWDRNETSRTEMKHRKNCETALFKVWIVEHVFCRKEGRKEGCPCCERNAVGPRRPMALIWYTTHARLLDILAILELKMWSIYEIFSLN